jgi:hypothetical protein
MAEPEKEGELDARFANAFKGVFDDRMDGGDHLSNLLKSRGYQIQRFTRYKAESGFIWATRKNGN